MNCGPTKNQILEFLSIMSKLKVQNNPNLSPIEKETLKQTLDGLKRMAQQQ